MAIRKGVSIAKSIANLTAVSPSAQERSGTDSPQKAILQKIAESIMEAMQEAVMGATHQLDWRIFENISISASCETKKAEPEAKAILKFDNHIDRITPMINPI